MALSTRAISLQLTPLSLVTLLALSSLSLPAHAAPGSDDRTVWLKPSVSAPTSAKAPIYISLAPSENACRKAYGDDWYSRCMITLGRSGATVEGITLKPSVPGTWRWAGPDSLAFTPKDAWQPKRSMRASLLGIPIPLRANIEESFITIETPPLAAINSQSRIWIDPAVKGERWLSFEFFFTTVPEKGLVEKAFSLNFKKESGLETAKPQFIWSDDGTSVYVKVKLTKLPEEETIVTAKLAGIAGRISQNNGRFTVPKGFETASVNQTVPGEATLFQISRAEIHAVRDEAMNGEYELTLTGTLQMDPQAVMNNIRVLALPSKMSEEAQTNAVWTAAPVIDEEILSRAEPVEVMPASEKGLTTSAKFRLHAPQGTFLYVELPESFGPEGTSGLSDKWHSVLLLPKLSSSIEFLQPGNMLTLSGNWTLSLFSTGVEKLRWRIARVKNAYLALAADGWNVMKSTSPDAYTSAVTGEIELGESTPGKARFSTLDLAEAVIGAGPGLFQVELTGVRMKDGKEEVVATANKRLLLTNLAVIAKTSADTSIDVFAAGFMDGKPAANVAASLLAENGTVIESVQTDEEGRAHFKPTQGLEREKRPAAITVQSKGTDLAWISLRDPTNLSDTFRWNTGGRETKGGNMAAFSFADRGIYRAGETVHFGLGLRELSMAALPEGLPVEVKLTNDAGKVVEKRQVKLSPEGLADFDWTIPEGTLPGRIKMDVFAAGGDAALSTTTLFIADFAHETLSLTAELPAAEAKAGWVAPGDIHVPAKLTSLFGAGAEGRRIEGEVVVNPVSSTTLPGFEGWTFESPAGGFENNRNAGKRLAVPAVKTTGAGDAELTLPLGSLTIPGFARAEVSLTGFESEGGEAVSERFNFLLSRGELALGWKLDKTPQPMNFLLAGDPAEVRFIAVDRHLEKKAGEKLRAEISRTHYVTELTADGSGRLTYSDAPLSETTATVDLTTDASGEAVLPLNTREPGEWLIRVTREDGTLLLTLPYNTAGNTLEKAASEELPAAEMRARLEKTTLEAGDKARLSLLSPFSGFALITFESANVISSRWTAVKSGDNLIEVDAPEGFSGRAWLRVSLVRGQDSAKKFLRGFAETAIPVLLNTKEKRLRIDVSVPEKLGSAKTIPITLKADKPSRVFLWAADAGILSLTNYPAPNPLRALIEDRALEVETRETLSLLMPDASAAADLTAPFGGDFAESAKMAAGFGNPFARTLGDSAVWWGGLVEAGPEARTIEATLPEGFNGRIRIFAVGASENKAGAGEASAAIAEPLVIDPILPAAVSPGDIFALGATVTPETPTASGALEISSDALTPASAAIPITFPEKGGKVATTVAQAPAAPGTVQVTFRAQTENAKADRTLEIGVRPASVKSTRIYGGRIEGNAEDGSPLLQLPNELYPNESQTSFMVSAVPATLVLQLGLPFANRDWNQPADAIAAALPLVLLAANPDAARFVPLGETPEKAAAKLAELTKARAEKALSAIEGALSWEGIRSFPWMPANPYLTAWTLDYLLAAARTTGVPPELMRSVKERLMRTVTEDPQTIDDARTKAYALWVLTREGTMTTEYLETLRASMEERFPDWKRDAAAAFLAASYQHLRMRAEAEELLSGTISTARAGGAWTPETATALAAQALAASGLTQKSSAKFLSSLAVDDFAGALKRGTFDALYAGAAAMTMMEPSIGGATDAEKSDDDAGLTLVCVKRTAGFPDDKDHLTTAPAGALLEAPGCIAAEVSGAARSSFLWWQGEQTGWVRLPDDKASPAEKSGLEVERTYLGEDGKPSTRFRAGEKITVRVKLRAYAGEEGLMDIALTDLLPGGLAYAMNPGTGPDGAPKFLRSEERMTWLSPELSSWSPVTFTYTVRAATPGEFTVPPVEAQSLSRPLLRARGASGKLTILDSEGNPVKLPDAAPAAASASRDMSAAPLSSQSTQPSENRVPQSAASPAPEKASTAPGNTPSAPDGDD